MSLSQANKQVAASRVQELEDEVQVLKDKAAADGEGRAVSFAQADGLRSQAVRKYESWGASVSTKRSAAIK